MTELLGLEPAFSEICLFLFVFFPFLLHGLCRSDESDREATD